MCPPPPLPPSPPPLRNSKKSRQNKVNSNCGLIYLQPMEHEPYQETQPPSPMHQYSHLQNPVQEFWTPLLRSQGWTPSHHDKFISIAASSSIEEAFEWRHPETGDRCGCLTSALVEVIDEAQKAGKRISYNILKR